MILVRPNLVCEFWISLRTLLVLVVVDKNVPSQLWVFCHSSLVAWNCDIDVPALIIAGLDQESRVPSHGQTTGQGTSPGTAADDDILITQILSLCGPKEKTKWRKDLPKPHDECGAKMGWVWSSRPKSLFLLAMFMNMFTLDTRDSAPAGGRILVLSLYSLLGPFQMETN